LHLEKDTVEMSNSLIRISKCFTSSWYFHNSFSNNIQFARNAYLCIEPPRGAVSSLCDLKILKINHETCIQFVENNGDLKINFKIVSVENIESHELKEYWIKLVPIN